MINASMPSPIGHALAGVATAWTADLLDGSAGRRMAFFTRRTLICAALAALPDADLVAHAALHRSVTHSLVATIAVTIIAAAVTGWVTRRDAWKVAAICGAAYATHLLLDWLGSDPSSPQGIQLFWPFNELRYISGWDLFRRTERRQWWTVRAMMRNAEAAAQELAILGPVLLALRSLRQRRPS